MLAWIGMNSGSRKNILAAIGAATLVSIMLLPDIAFFMKMRDVDYLWRILYEASLVAIPVIVVRRFIRGYGVLLALVGVISIGLTLAAYFFTTELGTNLFWLIYNTDSREANELLSGFAFLLVAIFLTYIVVATLSIRWLPAMLTLRRARLISGLGIAGLVAYGLLSLVRPQTKGLVESFHAYYPTSLFAVTTRFMGQVKDQQEIQLRVQEHSYQGVQRREVGVRQVVVLVIGETSRSQNWGLNGYHRRTTPLLKEREGLLNYSNAVTAGSQTAFAIPLILTGADPDHFEECQYESGILRLFEQAGFRTYWITNQLKGPGAANIALADSCISISGSSDNMQGMDKARFDMQLVHRMADVIKSGSKDCLIVLHTMGSHYKYEMRYPQQFGKYEPVRTNFLAPVTAADRDELVNAYDNSILYTDAVLDSVMSVLSALEGQGMMLYASDHGENLYDDDRRLFGHAAEPTEYTARIPFLIYCNRNYIDQYPATWETLNAHTALGVSNNQVFSTLADMAGIDFREQDLRNSIAHSQFVESSQRVRGPGRIYTLEGLTYKGAK